MSSGKLRRDRSGSRERRFRQERDKRNEVASVRHEKPSNTSELNEEDYDEEWEHEWEDIEEIRKGGNKFQKPYGRGQYQRYRGRGHNWHQNRYQRWDYHNRGGSENGSEGHRKSGRKSVGEFEEDENFEMPTGIEMTNLKVSIQDGKRFAEREEGEDFGVASKVSSQSRFYRGRGSRGFQHSSHYGTRNKWHHGQRYQNHETNDLMDCREVLNRRKRRYSDTSESDLREKLLKKDSDVGDLREVIGSRDSVMDLRDIIEPPDMSLMDEFTEDIVGEIDGEDVDISIRVREDLLVGDNERLESDCEQDLHHSEEYDGRASAERFEYVVDEDIVDDIQQPEHDSLEYDATPSRLQEESWSGGRWRRSQSRTRERSFNQVDEWPVRDRGESFPQEDWHVSRGRRGSTENRNAVISRLTPPRLEHEEPWQGQTRDISRNRSRERIRSQERVRSPRPRYPRDKSFERHDDGARNPSWERERILEGSRGGFIQRGRGTTHRLDRRENFDGRKIAERDVHHNRGRVFSPERRRISPLELDRIPPINDTRRLNRDVPNNPREPERRRESSVGRARSRQRGRSTSQDSRGRKRTISHERGRRMRSISGERSTTMVPDRNRSVGQARDRSVGRERNWSPVREGNRDVGQDRVRGVEGDRILNRERNRHFDQEGSRNRNLSRDRNKVLDHERNRNFSRERNRSVERDVAKSLGRDRTKTISRERSPRLEREIGRERQRSALWGGPRTPSAERHTVGTWGRPRSQPRERPGSRGREFEFQPGRGKEIHERTRDPKDKGPSRPKDQELREQGRKAGKHKTQDMQLNRVRETGHQEHPSRNSKREHEENSSKDRAKERHRSPEPRNAQEKTIKKTSQSMKDDYKQRFVKDTEKSEKFNREDFLPRHARDGVDQDKKIGHGPNQVDSREWENIRDFQERRSAHPVGLPFLDEARRLLENSSQHFRNQGNRVPRAQPTHFLDQNRGPVSSVADHQKKGEAFDWMNQGPRQPFNHPEEERRRPSRWGSPNRREKPSEQGDSRKSAMHSLQSAGKIQHTAPNGKADDGAWQRGAQPSTGDSQWNKPRSDLSNNPSRDAVNPRPQAKGFQTPREVIFVRGLARDVTDMDIRHDISSCGLWPKDVRVVLDNESGLSRGLAFITFNSVDEASRWMDIRKGVLNLRQNNHAAMDYSNPVSRDWQCIRCHSLNFKNRAVCFQCNRAKEDCLDGWEETCPYPTNALLLRGLNSSTTSADVAKALKPRMIAQARLDGVKMGVDAKGRPRSVCFVQLTSVVDSMSLHKSLISEPLTIDNNQVMVAYCQLDKLPAMETPVTVMRPSLPLIPTALPPAIPLSLPTNNIPVVSRTSAPTLPPPKPAGLTVSSASIRAMLEGHYSEKDIPTLAQYCASAYAKTPQEQAAYVRYYTKHYKEKLLKNQGGGK